MVHGNPGLTSWAKFSRPYGTRFNILVLTQSVLPCLTLVELVIPFAEPSFS